MSYYKTKGINLKSLPYGESNKILTIFTFDFGKISAIAKGARKTTSKFGVRMDSFACNDLMIAHGSSLDLISQCETIDTFYELRSNLILLEKAGYMCRIVNEVSTNKIKNEKLFDLLFSCLSMLKNGVNPEFVAALFDIRLMDIEGVFPTLDRCVKCHKTVPGNIRNIRFNSDFGGVVCFNCSVKENGNIKIHIDAVKLMAEIRNKEEDGFSDIMFREDVLLELKPLIKDHFERHLPINYEHS